MSGALSRWDWSAIAAGVVVAVSLQLLLNWAGNAFALSLGDEQPGSVYAIWTVIVQLGALFLGAAFAAYLSRSSTAMGGVAVGVFTWALALVLGSALAARPLVGWRPGDSGDAAWALFLGALFSFATAALGGAFGAARTSSRRRSRGEMFTTPTEPVTP